MRVQFNYVVNISLNKIQLVFSIHKSSNLMDDTLQSNLLIETQKEMP